MANDRETTIILDPARSRDRPQTPVDKVPVSELANQFQAQPTLIHTRNKSGLAQPDRDFETAANCVCPAQVEVAAPPALRSLVEREIHRFCRNLRRAAFAESYVRRHSDTMQGMLSGVLLKSKYGL